MPRVAAEVGEGWLAALEFGGDGLDLYLTDDLGGVEVILEQPV